MSRLVTLYPAPNAYIAEALRGALAEAGIGCVVRSNEIPMRPGFNFGAANSCADILIWEEDLARAREVLAELAGALCGEEHDCETVYPPRINVRSNPWVVTSALVGWIVLFALFTVFDAIWSKPGAWFFMFIVVLLLWFVPLAIALSLAVLNWQLFKRTLKAFAESLVMLVILPFLLGAALARWVYGLLLDLPKLLAKTSRR